MSYPHDDPRRHALRITSDPFAEPVDVQEAKDHCRIGDDDEDALVRGWVVEARRYVEDATARQLVTATIRMTLDRFPTGGCGRMLTSPVPARERYAIVLPRAPLQAVASITYVDADGATRTLDPADYHVDAESEPARITPAYGTSWPAARFQTGAVAVTFRAGHVTPVVVGDAGTGTWAAKGRTFTDGDVLRLMNSGGELPGGVDDSTDYHVVQSSGSAFKLSTSEGGEAVTLDNAGQGTHLASNPSSSLSDIEGLRSAIKLLVGHRNENREAVLTGTISKEIELAVDALIWQRKVFV
jgi:uncharacterized phiE125 gp8 family phage protein